MAQRTLPILVLAFALCAAGCRDEGDIQIKSFDLEGVKAVPEAQLRNALQTKKGSRLPWGRKRYFNRGAFEADLQRIQAFYRDRGYPDARVASVDVKLDEQQKKVDLTVNVTEGEPIVVTDIAFEGFDVLQGRERGRLRRDLPLQPGQPLDRPLALASRERAVNALRDNGYAYAEVTLVDEESGPRSRRLVLRAAPGPLAYFGPVEIAGEASVGEHVIRRQLTFEPGDKFSRTTMRDSQRNLYELELFEFANIETREDRETQPTEIPARVTVAEGKHRKVNFGVGYGSEEKARVRVRWDHVNFFGNARHAGFEGKWSSLDRGVKLDFREPYFYSRHLSLGFDGQAWQAAEPAFTANTLGGSVTLRHKANPQNEWSVSLTDQYQRSRITNEALEDFSLRDELIALGLDPRTGEQEGTLSSVAFDVQRNTTNNVLDARRGYLLQGHVESAGRWLWGDFNYYAISAEGRHYFPLIRRRLVIANRLHMSSTDPLGDIGANVPFYKRYFIGGAASVRGWGRFELSPLSGFGLPIGGLSLLEGSTELRFPVWGKLGAVAFLDYGNVWSNAWDFKLSELKYAAGPGLRYMTPVGPARIDFGYQLTPTDDLRVNGELQKRAWRVHFSIGQAF
jgi:outer membrane protein assembly complex protein YaeT